MPKQPKKYIRLYCNIMKLWQALAWICQHLPGQKAWWTRKKTTLLVLPVCPFYKESSMILECIEYLSDVVSSRLERRKHRITATEEDTGILGQMPVCVVFLLCSSPTESLNPLASLLLPDIANSYQKWAWRNKGSDQLACLLVWTKLLFLYPSSITSTF